MNKVLDKVKEMEEEVKEFKETFKKIFEKGLPSFQDKNGFIFSKDDYNIMLTQVIMDHSKFEDMENRLKGEVIVNMLFNYFNILDQFQVIKSNLLPISIS